MGLRRALGHRIDAPLRVFLKHSAVVALIRIGGLLCVFGLQILLARLIGGSEEYGKYAWGQSLLFMIGMLASMNVPIAASRFIASLSAQKNDPAVAGVIRMAQRLLVISSGVLLLLALTLELTWRDDSGGNFYRDLSILALCLAPGVCFAMLYQHMCRARQWLILAFLPMQMIRPMCSAALALLLWWLFGHNLSGTNALLLVGISVFVVLIPQSVLYHLRQKRLISGSGIASDSGDYHPGKLFRTSLPLFLTHLAGLIMEYSNVLLLGLLSGPAAAGAYFAADRLATLAAIPKNVVSTVNQPRMAAAHATEDSARLQLLTSQSAHGSIWPTLILALALVFFSEPLLSMFGNDFSTASLALIILAVVRIAVSFMGPVQDLLIMTGRQGMIPRVMLLTAAIHLLSLFLLVPTLGAVGAALTSGISGLLSRFWLMLLVRREIGIGTTILG